MAISEFELIERYFKTAKTKRSDVVVGIGDDAAITAIPAKHQLAMTMDTMVAGVHFFADCDPYDLGWKLAAVNLSDLAAVGAKPAWALLSLTMPTANESWLQAFSRGLFDVLDRYQCQLIGGDTTQGPLTLSLQVNGFVPDNQAMTRKGANVSDLIYLSGNIGEAALGLAIRKQQIVIAASAQDFFLARLNRPTPSILLGNAISGLASSAIDISDGFIADLNHILAANQVGALIIVDQLPLANLLQQLSLTDALPLALSGGDDYELCFTIPAAKQAMLEAKLSSESLSAICIGKITQELGILLDYGHGRCVAAPSQGYQHFSA